MTSKKAIMAEYCFDGTIFYEEVPIVGERDGQIVVDLGEEGLLTPDEATDFLFTIEIDVFDEDAGDELVCIKDNLEELLRLRMALAFNSVDPNIRLTERAERPTYHLQEIR